MRDKAGQKPGVRSDRKERLASALRDNLKRRKQAKAGGQGQTASGKSRNPEPPQG